MNPIYEKKQREYEAKKARAKALQLRLTCTICGVKPRTLLNCPCGTTQYCSTDCQRIDWRDRGHRKACKKIRNERAAEAARAEAEAKQAEAPAPPPKEVFYGPAPRSHADEVRARIAAEHEAARARREANPEPEPESTLLRSGFHGSRCPICYEDWDINVYPELKTCCSRTVCSSCAMKVRKDQVLCPLCRAPPCQSAAGELARIRRHVENDRPECIWQLGNLYRDGSPEFGIVKSEKKAAKLFKRAVELGYTKAMTSLGSLYESGGDGVKLNKKKAMQLYQMAADAGLASGQLKWGFELHRLGNHVEAVAYMKLAAEQGLTLAEHLYAREFLQGIPGVPGTTDVAEAKRWLARAAAKGDPESIVLLKRLEAGLPYFNFGNT